MSVAGQVILLMHFLANARSNWREIPREWLPSLYGVVALVLSHSVYLRIFRFLLDNCAATVSKRYIFFAG